MNEEFVAVNGLRIIRHSDNSIEIDWYQVGDDIDATTLADANDIRKIRNLCSEAVMAQEEIVIERARGILKTLSEKGLTTQDNQIDDFLDDIKYVFPFKGDE